GGLVVRADPEACPPPAAPHPDAPGLPGCYEAVHASEALGLEAGAFEDWPLPAPLPFSGRLRCPADSSSGLFPEGSPSAARNTPSRPAKDHGKKGSPHARSQDPRTSPRRSGERRKGPRCPRRQPVPTTSPADCNPENAGREQTLHFPRGPPRVFLIFDLRFLICPHQSKTKNQESKIH